MLRTYRPGDAGTLLEVWNGPGRKLGWAPLTEEKFRALLLEHPDFSPELTFLLEERGKVLGFVNGTTGDHIPRGDVRGYLSCLILREEADTAENTALLLAALENAFQAKGRTASAAAFWNPVRLPWLLPGTGGHQHNNAPGIPVDAPLYGRMLSLGYRERSRERAMHLDLSEFSVPAWVAEKANAMAEAGDTVALYDPKIHTGLEDMLESLGNPLWRAEIPAAVRAGKPVLAALHGNTCAGFTGPIWPEDTGRGYFAGIGVAPDYRRRGFGTLLFYRLLEEEKRRGAAYMSLFTGECNPAGEIYRGAGFRTVRHFAVLEKPL